MEININTIMIEEIRNINSLEIQKKFRIILKLYTKIPNHKIVYTDDSTSKRLAIISKDDIFISSLEYNSIFSIEVIAIIKALNLI